MGNLRSVSKAIECVAENHEVLVTADPDVIASADRIVCPGQGAAADCMAALNRANLSESIKALIGTRPFMGICMGLQVLLTRSEENGGIDCINAVAGQVKRFNHPLIDKDGVRLKVPHMGWSPVAHTKTHTQTHPMWNGIDDGSRYYFAHSYYCAPDDNNRVVGRCDYGIEFAVALADKNLFACQFHPEKSARDGLQLLANFVAWDGNA
ncbi:UNVERIFIED_CONTAM: hypothetical protein GTU68_035815 [Idotea baltica]|nr:hypothetical protein [Idotea baltica]